LKRLIADDPAILDGFQSSRKEWPEILPRRTPCVSRDHAQKKLCEAPSFLQRILSKNRHDADATLPDVVAYLALVDRILEDRVINVDEESILVDAVTNWGLSIQQVTDAHQSYIHNLAIHALADGVVTDAERADLYRVARLLGYEEGALDVVLESATVRLRAANAIKITSVAGNGLHGKRVCFTGELQSRIDGALITRDVAEKLAERAGLLVADGVTKKLDLLIVADPNSQSGKAKKARQYGTRILADSVFWRMIGVAVE
jgi:DNA polymerase-3 subunit epsilon